MFLPLLFTTMVSGDGISTHVLDMTTGLPGRGMKVEIFNQTMENEWNFLKELLVILLSMIIIYDSLTLNTTLKKSKFLFKLLDLF